MLPTTTTTCSVPVADAGGSACGPSASGQLFLACGGFCAGVESSSTCELWDCESDRWINAAPLRHAMMCHAASLGGRGGSATGARSSPVLAVRLDDRDAAPHCELLDLRAPDWMIVSSPGCRRAEFGLLTVGAHTVALLGGADGSLRSSFDLTDTCLLYDLRADRWMFHDAWRLPHPSEYPAMLLLGEHEVQA